MEQRIAIDGLDFVLPMTIGAIDLGQAPIQDSSIDLAAAAVADAKRTHKHLIIVDAAPAPQEIVDDLQLLRQMPAAMASGDLEVYYQPKLRTRTNVIDSAEALIRWTHAEFGNVSIEPLIKLVEETGAIRRLTEWVIARAVLDRGTLEADGHDITIYVNLSGVLLPDAAFAERAMELISGSGGRIGFEITETAVIGDPERAMANLATFAKAGIKIAIDDYGSGLSSLAYLQQLPANELKIDRLFIKGLVESQRDPLLVRSSIDLAHALEMEVTAEGVENPMALALLRIMGCDLVQGYLISPAVPLKEFRQLLANPDFMLTLSNNVAPGWAEGAASPAAKSRA